MSHSLRSRRRNYPVAMRCPECGHDDSRVIDSRPVERGAAIRRRRVCEVCEARFTTYERAVGQKSVRKRSGRIEAFDAEKMRRGVEAALANRPVPARAVDQLLEEVEAEVQATVGPIPTERIGRLVLARLRVLDEVAYLRFASVYREFQGAEDFSQALAELEVNRTD